MTFATLDVGINRLLEIANHGISINGMLHPDRVTRCHDLLYLQEGAWEVWEEDLCYSMQPGDVLLLYAGRHHYGKQPCAAKTKWLYVHFPPAPSDRFYAKTPTRGNSFDGSNVILPTLVRTGRRSVVEHGFASIVHSYFSSIAANRLRARVLLSSLLLELSGQVMSSEDQQPSPVDAAIRLIERHPANLYSLDELASLTHLSRRDFTRKFRTATGTSVVQFQLALRLRMAREMLSQFPQMRMREVSEMLGFHDEFYFSRIFKKETGMPPRDFRQSISRRAK